MEPGSSANPHLSSWQKWLAFGSWAARVSFSLVVITLSVSGTLKAQEANVIPFGEAATHEMHGQEQRFPIRLETNEFLQVRVEQMGVDVELALLDSHDTEVAWMDSPNGVSGSETLSFVGLTAGAYTLKISPTDKDHSTGKYSISRIPPRTPTAQDLRRTTAEHLYAEGMRLSSGKNSNPQLAIERLQEAVAIWRELKDTYMLQMTSGTLAELLLDSAEMINKGNKLLHQENLLQESVAKANEAGQACRDAGDKVCEMFSAVLIGRMFADYPRHYQDALNSYETAIKLNDSSDGTAKEKGAARARILKDTAKVLMNQRNSAEGLKKLTEALALIPDGEDDEKRGDILVDIGDAEKALRKFSDAEKHYLAAKDVYHRNDKLICDEGLALNKLGQLYGNRDDQPANSALVLARNAFDSAETALQECSRRGGGYLNRRIFNLESLAEIYRRLGNKAKHLEIEQKKNALAANQPLQLEVQILNDLNTARAERNRNPQKEIELLTRVREGLWKLDVDYSIKIEILQQLAFAHIRMSRVYRQKGLIEKSEGEMKAAASVFNEAFSLVKDLKDTTPMAQLTYGFGDALLNGGDGKDAVRMIYAALQLLTSTESEARELDFRLMGDVTYSLGSAYLADQQTEKGLHYYRIALWLKTTFGSPEEIADTLTGLMNAFASLGKRRVAIFYGKQAVAINLDVRRSIKPFDIGTQKDYLEENSSTYARLADLLIQEGRLGEAHQILNRYQDQEFFDFAPPRAAVSKDITFTPHEAEVKADFDRLSPKLKVVGGYLKDLNQVVGTPNPKSPESEAFRRSQESFTKISGEFEAKLIQIEKDFDLPEVTPPPSPNRTAGDPCDTHTRRSLGSPDSDQMRCVMNQLEAATGKRIAVIYSLTTNDSLRFLLISKEGIKAFSSAVKSDELHLQVDRVLNHLHGEGKEDIVRFRSEMRSGSDWFKDSSVLYNSIFSSSVNDSGTSLERELVEQKYSVLLWSLVDPIRNIPVNLLFNAQTQRYLIEDYQSSVFTRANLEQLLPQPRPWSKCLGLGTSEAHLGLIAMPQVKTDLRELCGENVLVDRDFLPERMTRAIRADHPAAVFILSHFILRRGDAERSVLIMGDGQGYSLNQMQTTPNLFDGVELLVLGACETGTEGPSPLGDVADGFAELAQRLGAKSVVATLWSVSPEGTSKLMREFGQLRQKHPEWSKMEVLRSAQLALLRSKAPASGAALNHPYYWGSFVLYGDFR